MEGLLLYFKVFTTLNMSVDNSNHQDLENKFEDSAWESRFLNLKEFCL